jgi:hypothetical protein
MRKLVVVSLFLIAFAGFSVAQELAISTQANWWGQEAADREWDELKAMVTGIPVTLFTVDQQAELATWVQSHTGDGKADILLLSGQLPDTIYAPGNAEPDGSIAENFIDDGDGNFILNTGDYLCYVVNGAGTNAAAGLENMMDIPGISMWDDNTAVVVTADGANYAPSLVDFQTDRPFHLDELDDNWMAELVLAQNDAGTRADPCIVKNVNTNGRLGIFYQTASQDDDPRSEVIGEVINNWYIPGFSTAVDPEEKAAVTWGKMKL